MAQELMQKSPVEEFVAAVLPADRIEDLRRGLPAHIKAETVQRNLLNAVMNNPDLLKCAPGLIFREVSKAAALGLYLDKDLGEAYLIVARGEPQLRIGYRGFVKLGRQSGQVAMIYAHEVCANDIFRMSLGADKSLVHELPGFSERGDVVGYYAVVKYTNGDFDFEPMSVAQAHKIRDRSDGWKAYKAGSIKSTPWFTDEVEMSKKSAIRRLTKRVPLSPELAEAIKIEDRAEFPSFDASPPRQERRAPPPPPPSAVEHKPAVQMELAGELADEPIGMERARELVAEANRELPRRAPPPPKKAEAERVEKAFTADKAHVTDLLPPVDPEAILAEYSEALMQARDEGSADEAYADYIAPHEADLFPPDIQAAKDKLRMRKDSIRRGR